jgi:hypothetical protein
MFLTCLCNQISTPNDPFSSCCSLFLSYLFSIFDFSSKWLSFQDNRVRYEPNGISFTRFQVELHPLDFFWSWVVYWGSRLIVPCSIWTWNENFNQPMELWPPQGGDKSKELKERTSELIFVIRSNILSFLWPLWIARSIFF